MYIFIWWVNIFNNLIVFHVFLFHLEIFWQIQMYKITFETYLDWDGNSQHFYFRSDFVVSVQNQWTLMKNFERTEILRVSHLEELSVLFDQVHQNLIWNTFVYDIDRIEMRRYINVCKHKIERNQGPILKTRILDPPTPFCVSRLYRIKCFKGEGRGPPLKCRLQSPRQWMGGM